MNITFGQILSACFYLLIVTNSSLASVDISQIDEYKHLAPYASIIEDSQGEYDAESILNGIYSTESIIQSESNIPYMDFTSSTYWMKVDVRNNGDRQEYYYVELARPLTNLVRLYVFNDEKELIRKHESGDDFKFDKREYEHRKFIFKQTFEPNINYTLIIEAKSDGEILKLPIKVWQVDSFTEFSTNENFFIGLYYGIFILVILLFSLIGIASRERIYIYFVVYVLFLAIFQFSLDGLAYQYFWRTSPWLGNHAILIFAALSMISMYIYVREFLNFKTEFPKYNIGYNIIIGILSFWLIASFTYGKLYAITFPALNGVSFLAVIYILIGIYLKGKKEKRIEKPLLLAFIALSSSSIIFILTNVDIVNSEFLANNALKIGSGTEVIFLAIAMAGRYRKTQLEKLEAQHEAVTRLQELNTLKNEQTERLEIEVAERTKEIQTKNNELTEKNDEIINSINYAKRLQNAILPTKLQMNTALPEASVLYKPKDIVSGDFYWLFDTEDRVYFAVVDCTGHGVPGALMSVLGYNALIRCVQEYQITDSGKLLDKLKEIVVNTLSTDSSRLRDGMDISLCIWDKKNELQFSGAYNSLYLVSGNELEEIKGDRSPIGISRSNNNFTTHRLNLKSGDSVYLASDGFADQFGGETRKKYKSSNLKDFLLKTADLAGESWLNEIDNEHQNWKGEEEQIDDICILKVRF